MSRLVAARRLRRRAMAHRRLLSALLLALAAAAALRAAPVAGPTVTVLVAARDLGTGTPLSAADVASRSVPAALVPDGVLPSVDSVVGRMLAGPVRRGETLTDARLVGPSLLARAGLGPSVVATSVRLADAGAAALLRPGDRVDVYAAAGPLGLDPYAPDPLAGTGTGTGTGPPPPAGPPPDGALPAARLVASGVLVLTVPAPDPAGGGPDGALVVVAVTPEVARALAGAAAGSTLSVALRGTP